VSTQSWWPSPRAHFGHPEEWRTSAGYNSGRATTRTSEMLIPDRRTTSHWKSDVDYFR
jgi:hypothetical protein